jgi:hypothetical protein
LFLISVTAEYFLQILESFVVKSRGDKTGQYTEEYESFNISLVELGLVPLLEAISTGIPLKLTDVKDEINDSVSIFPESFIRSTAKSVIFDIASTLDSSRIGNRREIDKENDKKDGVKKTSVNTTLPPRQRLLSTMINTSNQTLQKNIFIGMIFLTGRSLDLSRFFCR